MKLTQEEIDRLRHYRNEPDIDDVRYKQIIKKKLLNNNVIIYLLNNKELEEADAENDDYFNVNIIPQYIIPDTQTNVQNFVCFECSFEYVSRSNSLIKLQEVIFYILCESKNIMEEKYTSCARHDLLAAEIIKEFQGCNDFGTQLKLVSDKPSTTDNNYATRTLIFRQETTNSPIDKNGKVRNLRSGRY